MQINELFKGELGQVYQVDPNDVGYFRAPFAVEAAYQFALNDKLYVAYFHAYTPASEYTVAYALVDGVKHQLVHSLTGTGNAIQVFRCVLSAVMQFCAEYRPKTVQFAAYEPRQGEFYKRLMKHFQTDIEPYFWAEQQGDFFLTCDPEYQQDALFESVRLDELFSDALPTHVLSPNEFEQIGLDFDMHAYDRVYRFDIDQDTYLIYFTETNDRRYEIGFGLLVNVHGQPELKMDSTGRNVAFKVYSTVMAAIRHFVEHMKPLALQFTGFIEAQTTIYQRLIRYAKTNEFPGYAWLQDASGEFILTRDPTDRERPALKPVREGAKGDLDMNTRAREMVNVFARWITPRNEDTPLCDIEGARRRRGRNGFETIVFPAEAMGLPDDLFIGFGWREDGRETGTRAYISKYIDSDTRKLYFELVLVVSHNAFKDTDVAYAAHWSSAVHEMIHYLDFSRGTFPPDYIKRKKLGDPNSPGFAERYINEPTEMNAHFQQGLADAIQRLASTVARKPEDFEAILRDHRTFRSYVWTSLPKSYWMHLTPENKRKLTVRIYKLYDEIRSKWPNVPAIQKLADELRGQTGA